MSGLRYLLDTNFLLGMMKSDPAVHRLLQNVCPLSGECGYSAVTRMELLGFPGITDAEESAIKSRLQGLAYLAVDRRVEDAAISLRRSRRVKLPDAVIAATALVHGLELLTLDEGLLAVMTSVDSSKASAPVPRA